MTRHFPLLVFEYFRTNSSKLKNKMAVITEYRTITWTELNENANRVANTFLSRGFKVGDKVALLLHNCLEYIEIIIGLGKAGIIIVPLNFRYTGSEAAYVINHTDSKALILDSLSVDIIKGVQSTLINIDNSNFFVIGPECPQYMSNYHTIIADASEQEPKRITIDESNAFAIMYTGGTTGLPKGVVRSNRSRVMFFLYAAIEFQIQHDSVGLASMPLFHPGGMDFGLLPLFVGGSLYIMPKFDPEHALQMIDEYHITNFLMVPTMLNMLMNLPDSIKGKYNVTSVKKIITAGEPIAVRTKERIMEYFVSAGLSEFYGSSEATMATHLRPEDQRKKIRSVGKPMLGLEVKILDSEGNELPPGKVGLIYSTGATLMNGYYKDEEANEKSFKGEWFTANDLGKTDEEGYFYVADRKDEMIITGGENVYPSEVENVLSKHPHVAEVAVIGVPDTKWGEGIKAVVVSTYGKKLTEEEIINFCNGKIARFKIPKSVDFVEELPKSEAGKILRRKVRESFLKKTEKDA